MGGRVWVFRHVGLGPGIIENTSVTEGQQIANIVRWNDNPSSSHVHIEVWKTLAGGYDHENMLDPVVVLREAD
jgi:hypothetical protein